MTRMDIKITAVSPLHVGSGRADVIVDNEIVYDRYGLPYIPGKRIKGLLYESALEIVEMGELSGSMIVSRAELNRLFRHGMVEKAEETAETQLIVSDFCMEEEKQKEWKYLEKKYSKYITPKLVLEQYTALRFQTQLTDGVAANHSLRNMRVLNKNISFYGTIETVAGTERDVQILALALKNINSIGLKRNRGFGEVDIELLNYNQQELIDSALKGVQ